MKQVSKREFMHEPELEAQPLFRDLLNKLK